VRVTARAEATVQHCNLAGNTKGPLFVENDSLLHANGNKQ
jgi:hypothetical protein